MSSGEGMCSTSSGPHDQFQPVDLASKPAATSLRMVSTPHQSIINPPLLHSQSNTALLRTITAQQQQIPAVSKPAALAVSLTMVQPTSGSRVIAPQLTSLAAKPITIATPILRQQGDNTSFPAAMRINTPPSVATIRLTTPSSSAPVQFLPATITPTQTAPSLASTSNQFIRIPTAAGINVVSCPNSLQTITIRPTPSLVANPRLPFRAALTTRSSVPSDAVRVTLVTCSASLTSNKIPNQYVQQSGVPTYYKGMPLPQPNVVRPSQNPAVYQLPLRGNLANNRNPLSSHSTGGFSLTPTTLPLVRNIQTSKATSSSITTIPQAKLTPSLGEIGKPPVSSVTVHKTPVVFQGTRPLSYASAPPVAGIASPVHTMAVPVTLKAAIGSPPSGNHISSISIARVSTAQSTLSTSSVEHQQDTNPHLLRLVTGSHQTYPGGHLNLSTVNAQIRAGLSRTQGYHPTQPARILAVPASRSSTTSVPINYISNYPSEATSHEDISSVRPIPNSPRPSILRRRGDGEREASYSITPGSPVPVASHPQVSTNLLRTEDGGVCSSGSTTISATSSPLDGPHSGGEEGLQVISLPPSEPSPRKKPRKQQLKDTTVNSEWVDMMPLNDFKINSSKSSTTMDVIKKSNNVVEKIDAETGSITDQNPNCNYLLSKPTMSLLASYHHPWKSRHNHFLRYSDVRVKDNGATRRPTVNEIVNEKSLLQKINGWKVYLLSTQMEEIVEIEAELASRLLQLQERIERTVSPDVCRDFAKVQELIKANLQRSKVIQDQVKESKDHFLKVFDHKDKVIEIINKYVSKRCVRKRERI